MLIKQISIETNSHDNRDDNCICQNWRTGKTLLIQENDMILFKEHF